MRSCSREYSPTSCYLVSLRYKHSLQHLHQSMWPYRLHVSAVCMLRGVNFWCTVQLSTHFNKYKMKGYFFLRHHDQIGSGPHLASYTISTGSSFPGVRRQGHEVTTRPNLMPKLWMRGATPPLTHVFMAWDLVNQRDIFTFSLAINIMLSRMCMPA